MSDATSAVQEIVDKRLKLREMGRRIDKLEGKRSRTSEEAEELDLLREKARTLEERIRTRKRVIRLEHELRQPVGEPFGLDEPGAVDYYF